MNSVPPNLKDKHTVAFIDAVVRGGQGVALEIAPTPQAEPQECFGNVKKAVEQYGGEIVFGWTVWEWPGVYIEAEHHAIWRKPDGTLVDITPSPDGDKSRVFVADPSAIYDFENEGCRRENIRKALSKDPIIAEFFRYARLRHQVMNGIHSVGQVQIPIAVANQIAIIERHMSSLIAAIGMRHTRPNDPCYCGSGRKFKKCHRP